MIIIIGIICSLLTALGYYRYKDYIAPAVLVPLPWGLLLLGYGLLDHGMQDLTGNVLTVISVWVASMSIGAWFFSEVSMSLKQASPIEDKSKFNPSVRKIYYYIAVLASVPLLYIGYKQATTLGAGDFFFNLRMANTGIVESEYSYGIWQYAFVFAYVSLLIELYEYRKGDSKKRLIVLVIVNLLQSIITMAKSSFFFLILAVIFSIMFKRKIKTSSLMIGFVSIIVLMSSIQLMRSGNNNDGVISDMFYVYILGGVPALDEIVTNDMRSIDWGDRTMRFFSNFVNAFTGDERGSNGCTNDITANGYLFVPYPTNVYTVIGPYWLDFGYFGVSIFGFIIGGFAGFLYKLARKHQLWAIIAYSYISCTLVLQFFGEYLFTNLSYTIQIVLLTLMAYKFNYLIKWR